MRAGSGGCRSARPEPGLQLRNTEVWLFALVGLLSTAMLGGFLLMVTGRSHRIENAVRERTAALQAEVREREVAQAAPARKRTAFQEPS